MLWQLFYSKISFIVLVPGCFAEIVVNTLKKFNHDDDDVYTDAEVKNAATNETLDLTTNLCELLPNNFSILIETTIMKAEGKSTNKSMQPIILNLKISQNVGNVSNS